MFDLFPLQRADHDRDSLKRPRRRDFAPLAMLMIAFVASGHCGCGGRNSTTSSPATIAAPRASETDPFRMSDRTAASGVHFTYHNDRDAGLYTIVEGLGGGVGLFDFDNDGRHDIFFAGGGRFGDEKQPSGLPSALFRNVGAWHFNDVTRDAGVGRAPHYTHGCAAADYDNDGFTDLAVSGYGGLQCFHNLGDGTFEETSQSAGLTDTLWSTSLGWGDLNSDGCLDLYVAHYVNWSPTNDPRCPDELSGVPPPVETAPGPPHTREICPPRKFDPLPDTLYVGNGDGTFRDATGEAQLRVEPGRCGRGLGVVLGDVDLDGDLDIYVANDTDYNFLYLNDGAGVLTEMGRLNGVGGDVSGTPDGSMGCDLADYDQDGLPDLWVVNFDDELFELYRNEGGATFTHIGQFAGMAALGKQNVGFGTLFADLDRDGDEDLVVANGHLFYHRELRQQAFALVNDAGRFSKAAFPPDGYFSTLHCGRGLATSDLDDDGDLDLVFTHNDGEENALVANETPPQGDWLRVRLIGRRSNRDAIGASLVLHTSSGDQLRQVKGGASYLSQSDLRPFWGIRIGREVTGLSIRWPGGAMQQYPLTGANRTVTIVEPVDVQRREVSGVRKKAPDA